MSWIYTIVFSSLFLSGGGDSPVAQGQVIDTASTSAVVRVDETERFEQTYPLTSGGRVRISNINGSITAEAWDRAEVKLVAVKTADSRERLSQVKIKIDSKPDALSVETEYENWKQKDGQGWRQGGKLVVDYQLMIPRGAVLSEIETVNGSVTLTDFTNVTRASAVNGTVSAKNLRGAAELSTVNGEVAADFTSLDQGSRISLETVNGKVNLTIPSDANATVRVDTLNGNIANDFGLPVRKGKYVGRDMYGRLGSGDVPIKLESVNGDLKISRQNDGRNVSPAVDLLPQKEKDDEDWDDERTSGLRPPMVPAPRMDKEISKAMKESFRSQAALEKARRELEKAGPEIERALAASAAAASRAVVPPMVIDEAMRAGLERSNAVLAQLATASFFPATPRVEKRSESFPVKGVPNVRVNAPGSAIKISGWDKNEIKYTVIAISENRPAADIKVKETHNEKGIDLSVDPLDAAGPRLPFEPARSRIEIFVPRRSNLKIKTDREMRIDGVTGEIELEGDRESINVRDSDGKLTIQNSAGLVRVVGFRGDLVGRTESGSMNLEGDFTSLEAYGGSGEIVVTLAGDAAAQISTRSPDVRVEGITAELIKTAGDLREYKVGSGISKFRLDSDGSITIRDAQYIAANR